MQVAEQDRTTKQNELKRLTRRDQELDVLFEKIYEDNATGKISDERFAKLSRKYEQEQGELSKRLKVLQAEIKRENEQFYTADMFLDIVRKYTNVRELSQRLLTELIGHIDVYHAKQVNGEKTQEITIHYRCMGPFTVPNMDEIPDIDILIETRKGVAISYTNQ